MKTSKVKVFLAVLLATTLFLGGSAGIPALFAGVAGASGTLEKITANLNHGISFVLNGEAWTPKDGNGKKLTPISYQGTTYVPLRAVAEATGTDVQWDSKKNQIILTSEDALDYSKPIAFADAGITLNTKESDTKVGLTTDKKELNFGEVIYTKAFVLRDLYGFDRTMVLDLPENFSGKSKKVTMAFGYKKGISKSETALVNITDEKGNAIANIVVSDDVVDVIEFDVAKGINTLYVKASADSAHGSAYIIFDESTIEVK